MPYEEKTVFPKLAKGPKTWAWTTAEPPAGWQEAAFDDSAWGRSAGGFGNKAIVRGVELVDGSLADVDIKGENTVPPVGYFHR